MTSVKIQISLRALAVALFDLIAVAFAWVASFLLRFNFDTTATTWHAIAITLPWVLAVHAGSFYRFGLYRGLWRFASLPDLKRILLGVGLAALAVPLLLFLVLRLVDVPRSVLILHPLLLVLVMGGARFAYRSWKDGHLLSFGELGGEPLLVLGAGSAGAGLLHGLAATREWRVVGFLDDDASKIDRRVQDVPVLGRLSAVAEVAARLGVRHVVLAMPQASASVRRHVAEMAVQAGLTVLTVPSMDDLLAGRVVVSQIRKVELEDLLGRERVELDTAGLAQWLGGRTVLVTGAGGSIGSELCRQIARFEPARLVFFEQSEYALYQLEQEFSSRFSAQAVAGVIGDVKDAARLAAVFAEHRPEVVFHAAAYKHVPLMESHNAWEAVRNNVLGTLNVARAAMAHGVSEFVLISTDKAVNPTNVMGASKRLAERACQGMQAQARTTRFVMVRFGNVLGSSGSVIPHFRAQIARGGPVTVTHPEIIRYFMLIPEATQLVLQAGLLASREAEGGRIFVLDMGEPVKIVDLARDLIRMAGHTPDEIAIEFTGLRPGEKLFEELLADADDTLPTRFSRLRVARLAGQAGRVEELLAWAAGPGAADDATVRARLHEVVAEYHVPGASG
ncbi:MAG: nucleoside-diphosphate sugar epimerase/dehydratase [Rugosibacter sp.]|nr:nucleoside-diphosphate sugar epimerase/dehydratase [Rugosibacter sp.]